MHLFVMLANVTNVYLHLFNYDEHICKFSICDNFLHRHKYVLQIEHCIPRVWTALLRIRANIC